MAHDMAQEQHGGLVSESGGSYEPSLTTKMCIHVPLFWMGSWERVHMHCWIYLIFGASRLQTDMN